MRALSGSTKVRCLLMAAIGWKIPPSIKGTTPAYEAREDAWIATCMRWLKVGGSFPMPPSLLFAPGFSWRVHGIDTAALARECQAVLAEESKPREKPPAGKVAETPPAVNDKDAPQGAVAAEAAAPDAPTGTGKE